MGRAILDLLPAGTALAGLVGSPIGLMERQKVVERAGSWLAAGDLLDAYEL